MCIRDSLNKTPYINITWKIEKDLKGIKENTKKGHDYAARVFAIKKTGATPLSNRAINYVFSSNSEVGENWPSPYTKKSIDNVLASTKNNFNEWVTVKANVKEDFKRFHDLDVDELDGLAIMADTDNSKMKSISYFQNIYFSENWNFKYLFKIKLRKDNKIAATTSANGIAFGKPKFQIITPINHII